MAIMISADSRSELPGSSPRIESIRNIGILAHIDAGKTSLTEQLLHVAGKRPVAGGVDEGTTATDYLEIERERGITIKAASVNLSWKGAIVHLIDTPGHVDFGAEVDRSLRAMDGAIIAVCGVAGVQSRTEVLIRACAKAGLPRIIFVNKMDRRGADFTAVVNDLRSGIEPGALAVMIPWGQGETLAGIIDLVHMRAFAFSQEETNSLQGSDFRSDSMDGIVFTEGLPIPSELMEAAKELRSRLIEILADHDSLIMEDYMSGSVIPSDRLMKAIRAATVSCALVPVLCGTAFSEQAAGLLLDAASAYLPSPAEAATPEGTEPPKASLARRNADRNAPFSGLVFKSSSDPQIGRLSWTRIWSGEVKGGSRILDSRSGRILRVKRIFSIQADVLEELPIAEAGDIVAISFHESQFSAGAGSTLCAPAFPILYESLDLPEPVVSIVVEPKNASDSGKIGSALASLAAEDPALRVSEDPQTGRYELSGLGELHLEVAIERLARDYGARIRTGNPRVAYRETIVSAVRHREEFDRDVGGERIRSAVEAEIFPLPRGSGMSVIAGEGLRIPAVWVEAARRGLLSSISVGPVSGYPLDDVRGVIRDILIPSGSGRIAEVAVEAAASLCGRHCILKSGGIVLEPVMRMELEVPDAFFGSAAAAMTSRGGRIESVEDSPTGKLIIAAAPMRVLFGFASEIRSATEGRAVFQARFYRFEPAPAVTART